MAADIFGSLLGKVDELGTSMVQTLYTNFAASLQPVFLVGLTVYIGWWGYEMLFGRAPMTAGAFVWRLGRILLLYTLAFSWGDFQPLVVSVLTQAPNSVAAVICQAAGGTACGTAQSSMSQGLTDIWTAAASAASQISAAGGFTGVGLMILSYIVLIIAGIMLAVAVFLLMFGKMAMFVLLATAPIFLACALFDFTSPITDGWMRSLAQYALLPIIVYAILGVMLILLQTSIQDIQTQIDGESAMTVVAPFLLMCAVTTFLLLQSINIAHGIAGGARLDGSGGGAIYRGARRTIGRAGDGGKVVVSRAQQNVLNSAMSSPALAQIEGAVKQARS